MASYVGAPHIYTTVQTCSYKETHRYVQHTYYRSLRRG